MSAPAFAPRTRPDRPRPQLPSGPSALLFAALLLVGCGVAGPKPRVVAAAPTAGPVRRAPPVRVSPAPLRRLTNEEYNNTVRDLLGDVSRPADAFAPDEAVGGFENNTVSPVTQTVVERYVAAAESLASAAFARLDRLAPCGRGEEEAACADRFIERFGRSVYRRPLEPAERAALRKLYAEKAAKAGHARGVRLVLQTLLQSPKFLYRFEPAHDPGATTRPLTGFELATRLSYFVWATTPDEELLDAAASGALDTAEGVERAVRRMLGQPRAVDGVRSFHRQWLDLRELETSAKNAALYPAYTPELRSAMIEETLRFGAHAVLAGGDGVRTLLTSQRSFVNGPLAKLYGLSDERGAPRGSDHVLVDLPSGQRAGLLTQASVLTLLAYPDESSPILRGKFVREKLLCEPIAPPPPSFVIALPKPDPTRTKRDRFEQHRMDPRCASCHEKMDPIGFGFEHYDSIGAFRTVDGAFPVDALGALVGTKDTDGSFEGALALGERLAKSPQVRRCIATHWFRAALGRVERPEDDASREGAYEAFSAAGFDLRELVVGIAKSDAFRYIGFEAVSPGHP